eukprot:GAHX01000942.1.p1 GENE.GAHX01000942.1~~GAHX01000942.1.p1  ORF type:complete len:961 (-),score=263.13 GAHX01000942.1:43-2925(-)
MEVDQEEERDEELTELLTKAHKLSLQVCHPHKKSKHTQDSSIHRQALAGSSSSEDDILDTPDDEDIPTHFEISPPFISNATMRNYQIEGLNWLIRCNLSRCNGILADEMGLGKTLQSISILAYLKEHRSTNGPHLIVVPKSTITNWQKEFERFAPQFVVQIIGGEREARRDLIKSLIPKSKTDTQKITKKLKKDPETGEKTEFLHIENNFDFEVLLTTYTILKNDFKMLKKVHWNYLILDEAHKLKNEHSITHGLLKTLRVNNRLLLTGTPLQNDLGELFALLSFLSPSVFADSEKFQKWFNIETTEKSAKVIAELHLVLKPFILRRIKSEVEKSLPPKKESMLFVGLTEVQRQLYMDIVKKDAESLQRKNVASVALRNILMQLRKTCSHPYLFSGIEPEPISTGEHLIESSGKLMIVDQLLKKCKMENKKVLIFSQFVGILDILEDYCLYRKYSYCRLDGSTEQEDRDKSMAQFNKKFDEVNKKRSRKANESLNDTENQTTKNDEEDKFVFILSTRAGGLGINLQAASVVILFDSDWNPQMDLQAIDRAHRIGQTQVVEVYRIVTEGTVDQKVAERAAKKMFLNSVIIQKKNVQKDTKKDKETYLKMIRFGVQEIFELKHAKAIKENKLEEALERGSKMTAALKEELKAKFDYNTYDFNATAPDKQKIYNFEGTDYSEYNKFKEAENLDFAVQMAKIEREMKLSAGRKKETEMLNGEKKEKKEEKEYKAWQFFDVKKIQKLESSYKQYLKTMSLGNGVEPGLWDDEKQSELEALKKEGFDWKVKNFNSFIRASETHGRNNLEKIKEEMRDIKGDEVERYHKVFWKDFRDIPNYSHYISRITNGEARNRKTMILTSALEKYGHMLNEEYLWNIVDYDSKIERFIIELVKEGLFMDWEEFEIRLKEIGTNWFSNYWMSRSKEEIGKRVIGFVEDWVNLIRKNKEINKVMKEVEEGVKIHLI